MFLVNIINTFQFSVETNSFSPDRQHYRLRVFYTGTPNSLGVVNTFWRFQPVLPRPVVGITLKRRYILRHHLSIKEDVK